MESSRFVYEVTPQSESIDTLRHEYLENLNNSPFGSDEYYVHKRRYVVATYATMEAEADIGFEYVSQAETGSRLNELITKDLEALPSTDKRIQFDLRLTPKRWTRYTIDEILKKVPAECNPIKNYQELLYGLKSKTIWLLP